MGRKQTQKARARALDKQTEQARVLALDKQTEQARVLALGKAMNCEPCAGGNTAAAAGGNTSAAAGGNLVTDEQTPTRPYMSFKMFSEACNRLGCPNDGCPYIHNKEQKAMGDENRANIIAKKKQRQQKQEQWQRKQEQWQQKQDFMKNSPGVCWYNLHDPRGCKRGSTGPWRCTLDHIRAEEDTRPSPQGLNVWSVAKVTDLGGETAQQVPSPVWNTTPPEADAFTDIQLAAAGSVAVTATAPPTLADCNKERLAWLVMSLEKEMLTFPQFAEMITLDYGNKANLGLMLKSLECGVLNHAEFLAKITQSPNITEPLVSTAQNAEPTLNPEPEPHDNGDAWTKVKGTWSAHVVTTPYIA